MATTAGAFISRARPDNPAPFHLALGAAAASARAAAAATAGLTLAQVCAHFPGRGEALLTVCLNERRGAWWRRRPYLSLPAATPAVAAVATAAAAAAILRDDAVPKHAPTYATLDALVGCGGGDGVVGLLTAPAPDGAWRAARRAAAPGLGPAGVTARWAAIAAAAGRAADLVVPGSPVNLDDLATRAALDAAGALVLGVEVGATGVAGSPRRAGPTGADALLTSLAAGLVEVDARWARAAASERTRLAWWGVSGWQGRRPPPPPLPLPSTALTTFHACIRRLVGESLSQAAGASWGAAACPAPVVVELAARGGQRGAPLPPPSLAAHAGALVLAGGDGAGHAAAWAVALLAAHPAAAARAEAELRGGGGRVVGGGAAKPLAAADVAPSATGGGRGGRLPFLRACLLESMRLFPPAPAAVRAGTGRGGGKGAASSSSTPAVLISPHAWHRCPAHFGAPATFLPERWLVEGAEWMGGGVGGGEPSSSQRRWRRFAPFGEGARACPGAALANALGVALLASLVGRFQWRLVVGEGAALASPAALLAHLHTRVAATTVTLAPAGGLWAQPQVRR